MLNLSFSVHYSWGKKNERAFNFKEHVNGPFHKIFHILYTNFESSVVLCGILKGMNETFCISMKKQTFAAQILYFLPVVCLHLFVVVFCVCGKRC